MSLAEKKKSFSKAHIHSLKYAIIQSLQNISYEDEITHSSSIAFRFCRNYNATVRIFSDSRVHRFVENPSTPIPPPPLQNFNISTLECQKKTFLCLKEVKRVGAQYSSELRCFKLCYYLQKKNVCPFSYFDYSSSYFNPGFCSQLFSYFFLPRLNCFVNFHS